MDLIIQFAMVIIPLIPIFLMSRMLILMCREFMSAVPAILIGNGVAFTAMFVLGAFALETNGAPQWARSLSLFSVYGLVVLYDVVRTVLKHIEPYETDLLPPSANLSRQMPIAKNRRRSRV